jgi:hypothetical protein
MLVSKPTIKALFVLLLCTVVYYWKILLTHDYSILVGYEGVSQGYAWLQQWIMTIRDGVLPLWDPYALAGHPFAGEMQTAAFYPLHLLLVLLPFNRHGVFSPQLFNEWFALTHFLGACFMFALARELGLRRFPSIIAGICFSLGGLLGGVAWPDMVDSAIWLPLIFLLLLRALKAENAGRSALYASLSGLGLGMAILAGRLHLPMMQALAVLGAVTFAALYPQLRQKGPLRRTWIRPATVLAIVTGVAFCTGAVQLFPSMEYGPHALRFFGSVPALPANQRIPSNYPTHGLWPQGLWAMMIAGAFGGRIGGGEVLPFHLGVFPLLAAVVGIWKRWDAPWVRYLTGLAVVAFLYSLGEFSAVHGLLRAVIPYLWTAREASRFMYLATFALSMLAGFGIEALLHGPADEPAWRPLTRVLTWIVIGCAIAQAIPALFENLGISPWASLSILLIFASYGLYRYVIRGHCGTAVRFVMLALILFDLTTFNWTPRSRLEAAQTGSDALERALSTRGAVDFLKSRPGRFRVHIPGDSPPPIGDLFRVPTVDGGMRATLLQNYLTFALGGRLDLFNVRYLLKPASATEPGDVYHDSKWKVYENPNGYPPAWMVHEAIVEPSAKRLRCRLDSPDIDLHRQALLGAPLESALEPRVEGASEDVKFGACGPNRLELTARAQTRGLLVLSEVFYPGWRATVNGEAIRIHEVDGGLRGVVVPRGENRIVLRYSPWSFWLGALLTVAAFSGTLLAVFLTWRKDRKPEAIMGK